MSNPYISLLKTAWKFARHEKKRYVLVYAMFIVTNIVVAMNPLLYGWFIDSIQREGSQVLTYVWLYGAGYMGLRLVEWAFHGPARVMERKLAFNVSRNFIEDLYHKVLHLPVKWHKDNHSGSTINRIRKAYEALNGFFQGGFIYLHSFSKFFFSFAAIIYFLPLFGSIGVLIGLLTVWIIFKFDKPFVKSLKEVNEGEHKVSSTLFDSLSNILTVITLRLEKRMESGLLIKVMNISPAFKRNITINEWKWFAAHMMVGLIYVIITIGYVYQNWTPGETFFVGGLVTMLGFVNQFNSVFYDVASQYTRIVQYNTDVQTACLISEEYDRQHRPETTQALPTNWRTINISNLHFSHPATGIGNKRLSGLHDFAMHIVRGQKIALIGESGSGKSTLLTLLRGLYMPANVNLEVDGKSFRFESIGETVTLLPQEPEIFENTIAYNITLGLPFSEEEIMQVCEIAQFAEVVKHLPQGLDTIIQEKGVNFSGGQKQRLALARGILAARSSNIVLMDEPTSSVDPKTEVQLYDKMFKAFTGKAVISSLHRLHLLTHFDYVYILRNGQVINEGTFDKLRLASPVFNELWQHQEEPVGGVLLES